MYCEKMFSGVSFYWNLKPYPGSKEHFTHTLLDNNHNSLGFIIFIILSLFRLYVKMPSKVWKSILSHKKTCTDCRITTQNGLKEKIFIQKKSMTRCMGPFNI